MPILYHSEVAKFSPQWADFWIQTEKIFKCFSFLSPEPLSLPVNCLSFWKLRPKSAVFWGKAFKGVQGLLRGSEFHAILLCKSGLWYWRNEICSYKKNHCYSVTIQDSIQSPHWKREIVTVNRSSSLQRREMLHFHRRRGIMVLSACKAVPVDEGQYWHSSQNESCGAFHGNRWPELDHPCSHSCNLSPKRSTISCTMGVHGNTIRMDLSWFFMTPNGWAYSRRQQKWKI